jgi:serine/threonine protein kinase
LQDLKPLNIMKVGEDWKLIDFDAAAKIGEKSGLKSSTGYAPPELLILSSVGAVSVRDPTQVDALTADSSFDMWSFGALLYLLITGETLFKNNTEDNLNNRKISCNPRLASGQSHSSLCSTTPSLLGTVMDLILQVRPLLSGWKRYMRRACWPI